MVTVSGAIAMLVVVLLAVVVTVGGMAIRHQDRMFPKGFDRTGWNPGRGRAGWLLTTFTWLGGGRGP